MSSSRKIISEKHAQNLLDISKSKLYIQSQVTNAKTIKKNSNDKQVEKSSDISRSNSDTQFELSGDKTIKKIFSDIYKQNSWTSSESKSGLGSELGNTETIRKELPEVFKKFNIKTVLDIPCGDFNWMSHVDLKGVNYIGADIVEEMINDNKEKFKNHEFKVLDITEDELPEVDLIFTRDLLGHFDYTNIERAMNNILRSKSKYLLTTSFTKWEYNINIENGDWRPINLMIKPFTFIPIYLINENCFEGDGQFNDKCLLLFDLDQLHRELK